MTRLNDINRPRDGLVQISVMSAIDVLARRCLLTWLNWVTMWDILDPVFNRDLNIGCWRTSKGNRLWSISLTLESVKKFV
ncbi:MAG: hypothetical protein PT937_04765 [Lactobacillaceae bacterium]|uniref:hypothetical protein n=1 Tax=Limosilactobacillus sp. TaxID=2773925 RepID=UPI002A750F3B|nr:hypothetical protein [Limosilactobacillus sp.]MDD7693671.1 hypothetical protein [Lactobacillaceae bacterium]MDY2802690.1 hypothetical protein [Limosilactobacillus sp.]